MKWKILLLISLLLLLAVFIRLKPLEFSHVKLPSFPSVTGFFLTLFSSQKPVNFNLYLDEDMRERQILRLLNGTLVIDGLCATPIAIGKTLIQLPSLDCKVEAQVSKGEVKMEGKNISVEANTYSLKINNVLYRTEEKITFKAIVNYFSAPVFIQSMAIENFKGKLEKLLNGQISTVINFPPCVKIQLLDFSGEILISNRTLLKGVARVNYWCEK